MVCKDFFPILFADDTNLIATHDDFKVLIQHANNEMSFISKWFRMNKLTVNVRKSNFMIFCYKNKKYLKDDAKIFINENEMF